MGIKQYLDANKNQSAKLGDQVSGVVSDSANQARDSVNLLNQEADQKIQGVSSLNDDVKNKIGTAAETLTDQERQQAKNTANARYSGPVDITGFGDTYNKASSAVNSANQKIGDTATEEGRMNLVKQVNTKPRTQGIDVFDNALLQAGGGREKLANVASQNQDLKNVMDTTTANIQNRIGRADDPNTPDIDESSGAIGQTNKAQADAYKTIQDSLNSWTSAFTPKVSQAQQTLVDQQNKIFQDIGDNPYGLDQETMDLLGLSEGQTLYGVNPSDYISQFNPSDINASNLASAQDYARYGALADLAGITDPLLDQQNIGMAGTAKTSAQADKEKLASDIAAANSAYQGLYSTANQGVLNSGYLFNPNAEGGYAAYIPGALTDRRDIGSATPKDLEEYWLPLFDRATEQYGANKGTYDETAAAIRRSLADWKNNQKANNVVKRNS